MLLTQVRVCEGHDPRLLALLALLAMRFHSASASTVYSLSANPMMYEGTQRIVQQMLALVAW